MPHSLNPHLKKTFRLFRGFYELSTSVHSLFTILNSPFKRSAIHDALQEVADYKSALHDFTKPVDKLKTRPTFLVENRVLHLRNKTPYQALRFA